MVATPRFRNTGLYGYDMIFYTRERTLRAFVNGNSGRPPIPDDYNGTYMSIKLQTYALIARVRKYVRCVDGTANDAEVTGEKRIISCSEYYTILILLVKKYTDDATADGHRLDTAHT